MVAFAAWKPIAIGVALAMLTLTGCGDGGSEDGARDEKLVVGAQQNYDRIQLQVALEAGLFEELGVKEIEVLTFSNIPAMFSAARKGQVDIAIQTLVGMAGYNSSAPDETMQFVGSPCTNQLAWMSQNDDALLTVDDTGDWKQVVTSWKGARIGVPAPGGILDMYTRSMLEQVGLDPEKDVEWINVMPGAASVAALKQDLADVVAMDPITLAAVIDAGVGKSAISQAAGQGPEEFLNHITSGYFAPKAEIEQDPEWYSELNAAIEEAKEFMADEGNKDEVLDVLTGEEVKMSGVDPDIVYEIDIPRWTTGDLSQESFDKTAASLINTGIWQDPAPGYDTLVAAGLSDQEG